jgi:hypothetical protein
MIYPLNSDCPTNPRVAMRDITFEHVTITNTLLSPGILRCNASNPCTNIVLRDVHVSGNDWPVTGYICEHVQGTVVDSAPVPSCM